MMEELVNYLIDFYRAGRNLVLLFDYDGTLAPIAEQPRLALPAPATRNLLNDLARQPGVYVGVLSGRSLDDLEQMVGVPGLYYAGACGLEMDYRGSRRRHPQAEEGHAVMARLVPELKELLATYPGAWVEDKRYGLTVHYRAVAAEHIEELRARTQGALGAHGTEVRVVKGPMAIEIAPNLGWTKGSSLRRIVEDVGPESLPLYAGDEANDEEALEAVLDLGGVALGVGPHAPSNSRYRLPNPAELVRFLQRLREALRREVDDRS